MNHIIFAIAFALLTALIFGGAQANCPAVSIGADRPCSAATDIPRRASGHEVEPVNTGDRLSPGGCATVSRNASKGFTQQSEHWKALNQ